MPVAIGAVGLTLLFRLRRPLVRTLLDDRAAWLGAAAGTLVIMIPFAIASWRSSQTFLFPLHLGTFNPNISQRPEVWSTLQEVRFFFWTVLEPDPIRSASPCRSSRSSSCSAITVADVPSPRLALASALGFVLLVHSFTLSEPRNLWRYAFGFATTLTIIATLEATARAPTRTRRGRRRSCGSGSSRRCSCSSPASSALAVRKYQKLGAAIASFGVPRLRGLGGDIVLGTLTMAFDGITSVHVVERGLALGLAAALAFALVERGPLRGLVLFVVVGLMSAVPDVGPDLAPRWTAGDPPRTRTRSRSQRTTVGRPGARRRLATIVHVGLAAVLVAAAATVLSVPPVSRAGAPPSPPPRSLGSASAVW